MVLDSARNKESKLGDLFSETGYFFKYIGVTLLVGVIISLLGLLAAIDYRSLISIMFYHAEISQPLAIFLITFGLLLAVSITLVILYLAISFSQVLFILVDRKELSIVEIIGESFDMMETFMIEYFILVISFIGWILLGMITCGIAFVIIIPYMLITFAYFYDLVKKDYEDFLKSQDKKEFAPIQSEEAAQKLEPVPAKTAKTQTKKTSTTKKASATKKTTTKKAPAKTAAKKTTAKKASATKSKASTTKKTTTKKAPAKTSAKKTTTKKSEK